MVHHFNKIHLRAKPYAIDSHPHQSYYGSTYYTIDRSSNELTIVAWGPLAPLVSRAAVAAEAAHDHENEHQHQARAHARYRIDWNAAETEKRDN